MMQSPLTLLRAITSLMAAALACASASACGGGAPPPRVAEEPIDTRSMPAGKSINDGSDESASGTHSSSSSSDRSIAANTTVGVSDSASPGSAAAASTSGPTPTVAPAADPAKAGKPVKGEKIAKTGGAVTAAECSRLTDKYIDLVLSGEGSPMKNTRGKELEEARKMVKLMAAKDPNLVNMQKACLRDTQKSQYTCAMNAVSSAEWQECLR